MIRRAAVLATALVLLAAACRTSARGPANELHLAFTSTPNSLSLIGNSDTNSNQLATFISDGLVGYDAQGRYVPLVARSWDLSPDGTGVTFHVRDGVKWHDGAAVTARDVVYTVAKARDPETQSRSWASSFTEVASMETPDDLTLVVRYAHPYADALEPWRIPLVPEHVASKDAKFLDGAFSHHPIGCGPFRFVSYDTGQRLELEAFDGYWGGRPPIDRVSFKVITSERTAFESLLLGQLDLFSVSPDLWKESGSTPAGKRLARLVYYRASGWRIDWNQTDKVPYFHDKRVRRAMLLALDRAKFVESVLGGLARPGISSFPPESPWSDPSIGPIPFDPAESRRLLDEAGWKVPAPGGTRERGGVPFRFKMTISAGSYELTDRIAAWMQQSLADVGVDMQIEKIPWDAFQARRRAHTFDAAMSTMNFDITPDRFDLYHSSSRDGGYNFGAFSDPDVDRLLEQVRGTVDQAARRALCFELQHRLDDLQPVSFLLQLASPVLHDPDLTGLVPSPVGLYQIVPGPRAWRWSGARAKS
jgi:peptide/nickel transport system substrate-binding protein